MKYILVTGGVLSGIGKGVIASSTGRLLKSFGMNITQIKIDPYLNVDAGTMSPFEHGEVFVLDDGGEVDLDLGNYERFSDITLTSDNNITTGKIYKSVIEKERRGDYLGKTVQVIPHICNEIQDWVERISHIPSNGNNTTPDVCVIELGGTVGDIESMPFIEAMRQFQFRVGKENFCCIHVSLVPVLGSVGEQKTKPTQMSVRELRKLGLFPDIIVCRSTFELTEATKNKISLFCHVAPKNVLGCPDTKNIYSVPIQLHDQGYSNTLIETLHLNIDSTKPDFTDWIKIINKVNNLSTKEKQIKIAMVGKYTDLSDAYLSVIKSLNHASTFVNEMVDIKWIEASHLENSHPNEQEKKVAWETLKSANGILVPGGFGDRGIEGKVLACKYSRENKIPYFGICLGLQIAVIEYCRNVLGIVEANSEEFNPKSKDKVVIFMPEIDKMRYGGTMRLGKRLTLFKDPNSLSAALYKRILGIQENGIYERHRHRYEVNPDYVDQIHNSGLKFVGQDETGRRQEIIELDDHPFFLGVQYHPEFKSRPNKPSPPFVGFLLASSGKLTDWKDGKFNLEL
jgi:CTP synthase